MQALDENGGREGGRLLIIIIYLVFTVTSIPLRVEHQCHLGENTNVSVYQ